VLTDEELKAFPEPSTGRRRAGLCRALLGPRGAGRQTPRAKVIGADGVLRDKPGFEVDMITRASASDTPHSHDSPAC
jgi:hypothetical protein